MALLKSWLRRLSRFTPPNRPVSAHVIWAMLVGVPLLAVLILGIGVGHMGLTLSLMLVVGLLLVALAIAVGRN